MNGSADARPSARHTLPREPATFVNRVAELEALRHAFGVHRLVTIVGPYGIGKTRLALRHAWFEHERGRYTVRFFDLVSVGSVDDLCAALGGLGASSPVDAAGLGQVFAALGDALVVLDNFEHLAPRAAPILALWLGLAPRCRFLVTSRERLRLADEHCFQLGPLEPHDAAELLAQRARNLVPDFVIDDHNREAVLGICAHLEGVPLALEMTAPWLQVLSARELSLRLHRGLALLHDGPAAHGRHASLDAAIAWSWDLLSPEERDLLAQAAIFRGQFTYDDVMGVVALPEGTASILTLLRRLRERSLLTTHRNALAARVDFAMSFGVRTFALARLASSDARQALEARHRARVLSLAARLLDELDGPDPELAASELLRLRPDLTWLQSQDHGDYAPLLQRALATKCAPITSPAPVAPEPEELPAVASLAELELDPSLPASAAVSLAIHPRGEWFRVDEGPRVNLGRRGPIRQILLGLVDRARRTPGEPASLEEVCVLGWPGELMSAEAAANRVYGAISSLRRLGLAPALATRRGGWLLDPRVTVRTST